jgi:hypothetical protein
MMAMLMKNKRISIVLDLAGDYSVSCLIKEARNDDYVIPTFIFLYNVIF